MHNYECTAKVPDGDFWFETPVFYVLAGNEAKAADLALHVINPTGRNVGAQVTVQRALGVDF